jgi:FAD/FMN-containing dehydrogenase
MPADMSELWQMDQLELADWSGFTRFSDPATVHAPRTEDEIVQLVRSCRDEGRRLRAVGRQTSWNALWMCHDDIMSTKYLDAIDRIDVTSKSVTCQSGVSLEKLHAALWQEGLVLDTSPALDWVTIGGAISTGSHGSGPASISSSMIGCRLVTAQGEVIVVDENHAWLDAIRVSLGLFGVLSTVTLRVTDAFNVSVKTTRIPTEDWRRFLSEGSMSYLVWFPHTEYSLLYTVDVRPPHDGVTGRPTGDDIDVNEYVRGVLALGNLRPSTFPARNRYLLDLLSTDAEIVGPAPDVLMKFRSDPVAGGEWAVPLDSFENAFADLQRMAQTLPLPIVWLKKVKGESAWFGSGSAPAVQCGIYHSLFDAPPSLVTDMVTRVENLLVGYGGRPHLGKLSYLSPTALEQLYPQWDDFHQLRRQLDSHGMFWTDEIASKFGSR